MPIYDYHCSACGAEFELLLRSDTQPQCPQCGKHEGLQRALSRIAPHGKLPGWRQSMRSQANAQGLMSHYSAAEKAKLPK